MYKSRKNNAGHKGRALRMSHKRRVCKIMEELIHGGNMDKESCKSYERDIPPTFNSRSAVDIH